MKAIASILLCYFGMLIAVPAMPLIQQAFVGQQEEQCTMSCCHHKAPAHKQKTPLNNCCNNMMCNPFGQYACCAGYVVEKESSVPVLTDAEMRELIIVHTVLVPNYSATCWHPPEVTVA